MIDEPDNQAPEPEKFARSTDVLMEACGLVRAPAVHTDELWGGPRDIENAGPVPVHVETKSEYWKLLNSRGLQLKNMQESSTGPALELPDAPAPVDLGPVAPDPFTQRHAEIIQAYESVLRKYGLIESLGCSVCWEANRASGCRTTVNATGVRIECRCGIREYRGPKGTTDQGAVLSGLTMNDETSGMLFDAHGQPTSMPTVIIAALDATIIRAYMRVLHAHRLTRTLWCRMCCRRRFTEDTAIHALVSDDQIAYACPCRIRFAQTT